ncbi:UDP-N-acetylmuramoylalanyl-D-glutamyl-2,6-diamin opimelate/D-alanyl-D-alanylligase [Beutenbergia cavernae DSM 12333]|uniref:UDP-N-acetylmuramoyl-tripeptide--D-alanyl-D-alanine ligase n=1 Tax=Beutenbergia cavernae (strain ATCC BAA-8 / DSM 12333 / CCUG 43141 / JCM 11478 / NBRC 16432 / NCIMB 13614 / HKI 0122) TaxID=471853 RepID=C5BW63_BEUC1|nr:UDP-N-acetylmuramoyl-tripeptide--D-alanyl-D-alanine ligase [Beutenbergia cavernae]ACQ80664.1 UDP-N-acetylmuramoylalanyl-D-glutamyl-2,6-diamin opimelate/D-alanyl-D-alanylligase [Beutenbergia cavernae DSM 12333]
MIEMTADEIASVTSGTVVAGDPQARVSEGVVIDSREATAGSLFVALPGEHVDGHAYVRVAHENGATTSLVTRLVPDAGDGAQVLVDDAQRALGDLARHVLARRREVADEPPVVVGITGSVGKTSTKDLLAEVLAPLGVVHAPPGSLNNELGLPLTVLRAPQDARVVVAEMGADAPGNLTYLTSIAPPDVAVVLTVGRAHLAGFGSVDAVAATKSELVSGLAPGGFAVLNADDERVAAMARLAPRVVTFGSGDAVPPPSVGARDVTLDAAGRAAFVLTTPDGEEVPVTLALVGEHHVTNALAAAAVGLGLGIAAADVAGALANAGARSPHRMHVVERPDGVTVVDDAYNANPESVRAALKALVAIAGRERRSVAVLGEMLELGDSSRDEHDAVGRVAVRLNVDKLVVVGEGARAMHTGASHEGSWGDEALFAPDLDAARAYLATELRPGDVVLVKSSKGAGLAALADELTAGGTA